MPARRQLIADEAFDLIPRELVPTQTSGYEYKSMRSNWLEGFVVVGVEGDKDDTGPFVELREVWLGGIEMSQYIDKSTFEEIEREAIHAFGC